MAGELSAIGTGKALTGQGKLFEGLLARKMALDARQPKETPLIKPEDFHIDNDKFLPVYSAPILKIHSDVANRLGQLEKQFGGNTQNARHYFDQNEKFNYQQQINGLRESNENMKNYLNQAKTKGFLTPENDRVAEIAYNPQGTGEDIASLNNPDYGITATRDYGFNGTLRPRVDYRKDLQDRFGKPEQQQITEAKTLKVAGDAPYMYRSEFTHTPLPETRKQAIDYIVGNDDVLNNFLKDHREYDDPRLKSQDQNERTDAQRELAGKFVDSYLSGKKSGQPYQDKPIRETAADKALNITNDGISYANAKNRWTQVNATQLPQAYTDVFKDKEGSAINLKDAVAWNVSHPDAAGQENKVLSYSDVNGNRVDGKPETVIYYPNKDDGFLIISVDKKTPDEYGNMITKQTYQAVPLEKNRGKIVGENGFDPKKVYEDQKSGNTKITTDGGEVKSTHKSSVQSGSVKQRLKSIFE